MARALRLDFAGALFHSTSRGNNRQRTFFDDRDRQLFIELLGKTVERFRWILYAYCLMPNHYHLFLQLTEDSTFSRGMKWLNSQYTQAFNARHQRVGHVFQGRPKAPLVEKETYFLRVLRYVVLNPVRAGMVERPEQYEWSSHRAVIGDVECPSWLAADDVLNSFAPYRDLARLYYREFVDAGIRNPTRPFDNLVGQIYLGSERWCEAMREKVELKPRVSEHPLQQRRIGRPSMTQVIGAVADCLRVDAEQIRNGHGGRARMMTAWLAFHEGLLRNSEIAAGLRIESSGHITNLIKQCEEETGRNAGLRCAIDECLSTLRGD